MSRTHYLANKFLTKITNFLYHTNLSDMETGYKLFTKKVLNSITLKTREFELDVGTPPTTALILDKLKTDKGAQNAKEEVVGELLESAVPIPITVKMDSVKVIRRESDEDDDEEKEESSEDSGGPAVNL